MPTPPQPPAAAALQARLDQLTAENLDLRQRLELAEQAREDLRRQFLATLEVLDESRRQLRGYWQRDREERERRGG